MSPNGHLWGRPLCLQFNGKFGPYRTITNRPGKSVVTAPDTNRLACAHEQRAQRGPKAGDLTETNQAYCCGAEAKSEATFLSSLLSTMPTISTFEQTRT